MSTICPKYLKYLLRNENTSGEFEDRLIFPSSRNDYRNVSYDGEINLGHSPIFEASYGFKTFRSEMKHQYRIPSLSSLKDTSGIRKQVIEKNYWRKMSNEVISELSIPEPHQSYSSEYNSNFISDRYPINKTQDTLRPRYPLHHTFTSTCPTTFYSSTYNLYNEKNILEPFKKSCHFTKPLSERMDNGWVL